MTRFRFSARISYRSIAFRALCFFALCLLPLQSSHAARDDLPFGRWIARGSGLRLQIKAKNTVQFSGDRNTTAFEVVFASEANVRFEYWMAIQSIKEIQHKVKAPKIKKPANNKKTPAQKVSKKEPTVKSPAKKPIPDNGPLRLAWLNKDAKIIVSFIQEEPPPEKKQKKVKTKKPAVANSKTNGSRDPKKGAIANSTPDPKTETKTETQKKPVATAPQSRKPRRPIPILELLVFQNGKLIHEAIYERDR